MSPTSPARRVGRGRVLVALSFVVALGAGFTVGCGDAPDTPPPPLGSMPGPRVTSLPGDCRQTVSRPDQVAALGQAKPGDTVCFTGAGLAGLTLRMDVAGTAEQPISLIADGALVRSIDISTDHVTVAGFTVADGDGLNLEGTGLVARDNVIRNAADDGIVCSDCRDALVESNTVWRTDGTGIVMDGDRGVVRDNIVSESVMREGGDADGIRFFGTGLRLTENTIRDIKTTGYAADEAPHTDCFQTYESESRPTYDVLIANNVCENVDVHCLIATGKEDVRSPGLPSGVVAISFEGNICTVYGSQAVLLEDFPNVVVRNNTFTGPMYRAIFLTRGSIGCTVVGNTVVRNTGAGNTVTGELPVFEIDDESRPGFHAENNTSR